MMEPIRQYVLSVICMTVMSGIVQQLLARNPHIGIIKVITGLIVTVTVLNPFLHLEELLKIKLRKQKG